MAWHVMIGDKSFGPMSSEVIGDMLRTRKIVAGAFVREDPAGHWVAVEASPFKGLVRGARVDLRTVALQVLLAAIVLWALTLVGSHFSSCQR